jgi:hypothetical protein
VLKGENEEWLVAVIARGHTERIALGHREMEELELLTLERTCPTLPAFQTQPEVLLAQAHDILEP